jgi:uncharacterized radical SAM superfamily Fe-S cluster-containing enzyme
MATMARQGCYSNKDFGRPGKGAYTMMQQTTTSLCNECYRQIAAVADPFKSDVSPMLYKICPEHGIQRGKLEKDREFYKQFNTYARYNKHQAGIISITDKCNAKCKYCYYPCNQGKGDMPLDTLHKVIKSVVPPEGDFSCIILSGGEPTCHKGYMEIIRLMTAAGIGHTMLTNGIMLDDDLFFHEAVKNGLIGQERVRAQISIHGVRQQGEEVYNHQISFLEKCRRRGLMIHMAMINLDIVSNGHSIMDEVSNVIEFMYEWRDVIPNFRVRTVCNVWEAHNAQNKAFNSEIFKQFDAQAKSKGKELLLSDIGDINNIYAINTTFDGMNLSMMAAPSLDSIDLGYLGRSPFMMANDYQWYTVPHALIVNEGMAKGWYRGENHEDRDPHD